MKTRTLAFLTMLAFCTPLKAEDTIADKVRRALDKTADKVTEIADKVKIESRQWYGAAKENLRLTRSDYTERATKTLTRFNAEITVLKEQSSGPSQRDYFKTRVQALDQHATYAATELERLRASESEEVFRARQASFDRTLWTLEAALGQAQEEAGL